VWRIEERRCLTIPGEAGVCMGIFLIDSNFVYLLNSGALGFALGKRQSAKVAYIYSKTLTDVGASTISIVLSWAMIF